MNMDWDEPSLDCDESFEESYDGGMEVSIEEEAVRMTRLCVVLRGLIRMKRGN